MNKSSVIHICSEQCSDKYVLPGDEKSLWIAIDKHACAGASVSQAFAENWMPLSDPLPLGCPLKDISVIAIREGKGLDINLYNAHQIHIYVDGGFIPAQNSADEAEPCNATWAFAVIAVDEHMQGKLICSSGGHVTFNCCSDVYLGEDNLSSFDPELYAQVMARLFILQQPNKFKVPIFIGYDNISAADCSFMKAVHSGGSILASLAAAIHIETANKHSITGFHVHSHKGHPWNELADSICNFYKNHSPLVIKIPLAPITRRVVYDYQMFVSMCDPWVLDSVAVEESHCYNSMCALPPDVIARRIDNPDHMQWDSSCEISVLFLKCAQFNVQTILQFPLGNIY